ncbi:RHS repeat-associated core domain-containing protein [Pseudomonas sp. NA-150]|uniref:RHS repeat-associated core domain-containing protein n=1 Tax=Pseudomonas sp. NA-150 TaxID=3367525 RepID=UPI0037C77347
MNHALHRHTPTLTAIDSRGLTLRNVAYHRVDPTESLQARITRHQHDATGNIVAAWDPRLNEASLANQRSVFSLGGSVLVTRNVDAGDRINRYTDAGDIKESWDSRGTHWQTDYDEMLRPVKLIERGKDQPARVIMRFAYVNASPVTAAHNQCGRAIREDDSAGSLLFSEYGLLGQPLSETRHFLKSLELPDWPAEPADRDHLLEPGMGATTYWQYAPTGESLTQIDALGNEQRSTYDVSGELSTLTLHPKGGTEHPILLDVAYNAHGQIEQQTAGNGVISRAEYDPSDGRLKSLETLKPDRSNLQALKYHYDPVGNIVRVEDSAQATRYFSNQRIDPINHYTYDSLYQLIKATGREALGATIGQQLPDLNLTPGDTHQLLNYTQHYQYDSAGNLTQLQHVGNRSYTRVMDVSRSSNRALPIIEDQGTRDFNTNFDANGNLQALQRGQNLQWDNRNQLSGAVILPREGSDDDSERYIYDAQGTRVRKVSTTKAKSTTHVAEVRYLPGLEIRSDSRERLEVITLQAGRCNMRYLHWVVGKPPGIENNQQRYNVDDLLSTSCMELDLQASLLSHEGYYPYGGSAWWAAKSALQATFKTIRYSGKERDASGLYYYGQRYYAPWLQRWINPDPAGTIDGLNLYRMVGNNPISNSDPDGRAGVSNLPGSNFGFDGMTRAGREERALRKASEAATISKRAAKLARAQELEPLNDAVAIHLEVLSISKQRAEAAHQQLLNYSSLQEHVTSAVKRGVAVVATSAIGTGAGIGGALLGTAILPGIGTAAGAVGGYVIGKTASVLADYAAERTGLSASVKLKTSPLSADKIFEEGEHKTVNLSGYAASKFKKMLPTTQNGAYKFGKDLSKTALGKAPFGQALKVLPEIPELIHENLGAASGLSEAKAEKLDNKLTGLIQRIDGSLGSITAMFDQLNASSVNTPEFGDMFKNSTAQSLSTATLEVTNRLRETQALGRRVAAMR